MPFRFNPDTTVPLVEQDSDDEIWDCVKNVVRTPKSTRFEDPEFGVTPLEFQEIPVDVSLVEEAVVDAEPRAAVLITELPDEFKSLVDHVIVSEGPQGG